MTTRNRELASIIDASGNITAGGNLTVSGTTTTISSSVQTMADPLIELNTGASSNSNDLGLIMERGSTGNNAMFIWDESNDGFAVGTTTATGASTGNISFSAAPFTASTITGTVLTGSTSVKTPLIEYTDGDDAITIADGGHITTGGNLSIGGSNNELRFYEGSNYVGFEAPALSANKIWVLPSADGSANQILKTDGSGNLSFTDDLTLAAATVNNYTGNGSTTAYTLSTTPNLETSIQAYVDGVYQFKNTFSFSGTTFTFDTAPDNGALIEILVWNTVAVNVPAASSVTNTTLNASMITGQTAASAVGADHVLIYDASATALRKALVSDLQQTDEEIQDLIGAMFSSNTETGISVTYQDGDGTLDLVIGDDTIVSSMLDTNIDIAGTLDVTGVLTTDTNAIVAGTLGIAGGSTNGVAISQGAISIKNGGAKSYIDLYCESSNAHYTRIEAAAHGAYSGNVTATLPVTTGTLALTSDIHTTEELQDIIGAMVSSNTESGITVAYQDADGTIDFTVGTLNQNTTGTAATVTGAAQTNITSVGTLTALTVDDITINGSTISDGADLTLDVGGDIILDAGGSDIKLKKAGTQFGQLYNSADNFSIASSIQDQDIKFVGNDNGSIITLLRLDASDAGTAHFNHDAVFPDNGQVQLGASLDLKIYHDGSNSYIDEVGTGILYIRSNDVRLMNAAGSETMLQADDDGAVNLYFNNAVKLQTEAGGLHITGHLDADNFKINGGQGSDGQVLTSTGSGVAWEAAGGGGGATFKTFGTSSIMIGDDATGTINAANYNTGLGVDIFADLTTGDNNVAVGFSVLPDLTTGSHNTGVGTYALFKNTTASNNTALGYDTLFDNTTGANNTAVGASALANNTTGTNNTAIGNSALLVNTTGSYNIAIGNIALDANTSGNYNVAVGRNCLTKNTTGHDNVGLGINVLAENTTGHYNVAIGSSAMNGCAGGEYNTAVGDKALDAASMTGNFNVAVGTGSLGTNTSGSSNTCLGLSAGQSNTTANNNCFMGESTGYANTTGADNTFIGHYAGYAGGVQMTTGSHNTYIGKATSGSAVGNIAEIVLGYNVLGAGSKTFTVGISYSSVHRRTLDLTSSATSFTNPSDIRLKENITDSNVGLNFINDLRPVTYTWKARKDVPTDMSQYKENSTVPCAGSGKTNYGFVAQEVKSTIDNYNVADGQAIHSVDPDGTQHLSPAELVPMLVKALQEADNKIEALVARVTTLEG